MMTSSPAGKAALRQHLRDLRRTYAMGAGEVAARVLVEVVPPLLADCAIAAPAVIAAYSPLRDEINPLPLLAALRRLGYRTALPVTQGRDAGLVFRLCDDATPMLRSDFGVMEPTAGEAVTPDALLVPLLGFDGACNRLGYGAGHYDRTLEALRAKRDVFAAGLAFDMQYVDGDLVVEEHDQPLDCIVTDKGLYWPDCKEN